MTKTFLTMALCLVSSLAFSQRVIVYLDNIPTTPPSVSKAILRYDKDFAYSLTFDDGSLNAYTYGLPALQGGFVAGNNTNYTGLFFTDGCGNSLPFKAGIAWNSANAFGIDNHTGNVAGIMTWAQLDDVYNKGWDVFNHSFSHRARVLSAMTPSDYVYEINQNALEIRNKTQNRIETPLFVVPSGDTEYHNIAYQQGQKIVFDQSPNCIGIGGLSVANPINFAGQVVHRTEVDNQINTGINQIGNVANRSAAGERIWYNEFTHDIDNLGASAGLNFFNFRNHVERIANTWGKTGTDKIWMAPLQEVYEYLTTRQTATYTTTLNGNQLIIDFNLQNVPTGLRRRPLTLVVNGNTTFSRVETAQGVQMTFNGTGAKKIINLDFANTTIVTPNPCDNDVTPPVLANCPQNINLTTTGFGSIATWTPPTATDNCTTTPSVSSTYASGATFPIGTTPVVYTAIDAKGNRATCSFNVTVAQTVVNPCDNDVTPPVLANCPQNINLTTTGFGSIATWTPPTATDNCTTTPSVSSTYASGATFPIGTTPVVYTAIDAKGNRATCNFNVTVTQTVVNPCDNDVTPPVLQNCPQNRSLITAGTSIVANWTPPTATDNCTTTPSVSSTYASGATFLIGTTPVVYTAIDAKGNRATCSFNVTVTQTVVNPCDNDVTPPVLQNCPQNRSLTTTGTTAVGTWTPPTAFDNCTITPSISSNYASGTAFAIGTTTVIYVATDAKSNRSTCGFNVVVTQVSPCVNDLIAPIFRNCPINQNLTTTGTTAFATWTPPTATDNCTTNPTISSNYASGQAFPLGSTVVTYAATDARGNRSICQFTINVQSVLVGEICAAKSDTPWQEWVSRVQFNTINNVSEKTRNDRFVVGYSDWRDKITTVNRGKTYPLSIMASESYSIGTNTLYYRAWIDFNGNGFFETSEKVLEQSNNGQTAASQTVRVPTNALLGTVRMRIMLKRSSYANPCESFSYGEVEDYSVNISNGNQGSFNLVIQRPTQLVPIVIHQLSPNPTESDIVVKLESLDKRKVQFDFYNAVGSRVKSVIQEVEKGMNTLGFDFSDAPQGIYFLQTDVGKGREVPTKFVKM